MLLETLQISISLRAKLNQNPIPTFNSAISVFPYGPDVIHIA